MDGERIVISHDAAAFHVPIMPSSVPTFWPEHDTPTGNAAVSVAVYRRTDKVVDGVRIYRLS